MKSIEEGSYWELRVGVRRSAMVDKVIRVIELEKGEVFYCYPRISSSVTGSQSVNNFDRVFRPMTKQEIIKWKLKN
jgi:hypothetical protein